MRELNRAKSLRNALGRSTPLLLRQTYYPYGFPVVVNSNSPAVMKAADESWNNVPQCFQETPPELLISVSEFTNKHCPSAPVWHIQQNLLIMLANSKNFAMCDLNRGFGSAWLTKTAAINSEYLRFHFVESMAYALLESLYVVTLRVSCVVKDGRGVLIFEESVPGKPSLAYALKSRGWRAVSDETTCFPRRHAERIGVGNLPVNSAESRVHVAQTSRVDYIVFVIKDKLPTGCAHLSPVSRDEARRRLHADVWSFGLPFYEERIATIEQLVQAYAYEIAYSDLDSAIDLLDQLLRRAPVAHASRS